LTVDEPLFFLPDVDVALAASLEDVVLDESDASPSLLSPFSPSPLSSSPVSVVEEEAEDVVEDESSPVSLSSPSDEGVAVLELEDTVAETESPSSPPSVGLGVAVIIVYVEPPNTVVGPEGARVIAGPPTEDITVTYAGIDVDVDVCDSIEVEVLSSPVAVSSVVVTTALDVLTVAVGPGSAVISLNNERKAERKSPESAGIGAAHTFVNGRRMKRTKVDLANVNIA